MVQSPDIGILRRLQGLPPESIHLGRLPAGLRLHNLARVVPPVPGRRAGGERDDGREHPAFARASRRSIPVRDDPFARDRRRRHHVRDGVDVRGLVGDVHRRESARDSQPPPGRARAVAAGPGSGGHRSDPLQRRSDPGKRRREPERSTAALSPATRRPGAAQRVAERRRRRLAKRPHDGARQRRVPDGHARRRSGRSVDLVPDLRGGSRGQHPSHHVPGTARHRLRPVGYRRDPAVDVDHLARRRGGADGQRAGVGGRVRRRRCHARRSPPGRNDGGHGDRGALHVQPEHVARADGQSRAADACPGRRRERRSVGRRAGDAPELRHDSARGFVRVAGRRRAGERNRSDHGERQRQRAGHTGRDLRRHDAARRADDAALSRLLAHRRGTRRHAHTPRRRFRPGRELGDGHAGRHGGQHAACGDVDGACRQLERDRDRHLERRGQRQLRRRARRVLVRGLQHPDHRHDASVLDAVVLATVRRRASLPRARLRHGREPGAVGPHHAHHHRGPQPACRHDHDARRRRSHRRLHHRPCRRGRRTLDHVHRGPRCHDQRRLLPGRTAVHLHALHHQPARRAVHPDRAGSGRELQPRDLRSRARHDRQGAAHRVADRAEQRRHRFGHRDRERDSERQPGRGARRALRRDHPDSRRRPAHPIQPPGTRTACPRASTR